MRITVETDTNDNAVAVLRRFRLDRRAIDVVENLDQWPGTNYCYFKVRGSDGNLYILRRDEACAEWELTMFQRAWPRAIPASSTNSGRAPQ
jgi:hypothetical protein